MSKSAIIWWKVKKDKRRMGVLLSLLSFGWGGSFLKVLRAETAVMLPDHVEKSVNTIGMLLYALCRELNTACTDSPPCSPRNPKPVPHFFIKSTAWSSKKWSLGWMVAVGMVVQ